MTVSKKKDEKVYLASDLFFTSWEELKPNVHAFVYALKQNLPGPDRIEPGQPSYGFMVIQILRHLRKNQSLVNKLKNEENAVEIAVDIFNDLAFLNQPWYFFPDLGNQIQKPDDKMARHTFDQFIYADNEYSMFLSTRDIKYLRRLVVTLYAYPGDTFFDKERVSSREAYLNIEDWELNLVFFTYAHVRTFVTNRCKMLLPAAAAAKPAEGEAEAEVRFMPTGALWLKLKHRLAETPAFQGYDNAGRANMYSALDYLEDLAQQKFNESRNK